MTRNPNTRISELHLEGGSLPGDKMGALTLGSLIAAGFILVVSLITRRFYQ